MPTKPETRVVEQVLNALHSNCAGFYFNVHGSPYQGKGVSDILGCHKGRFIAVEVKRPKGESYYDLTPHQKRFLRDVNKHGGIGVSARTPEEAVRKVNDKLLLSDSVPRQTEGTESKTGTWKYKERSNRKTYGL